VKKKIANRKDKKAMKKGTGKTGLERQKFT
jgi:hypothetical protein